MRVSWEDLGAEAGQAAAARRAVSAWLSEDGAGLKVRLGCKEGRWSGITVGGVRLAFGPELEATLKKGREVLAQEAARARPPGSA